MPGVARIPVLGIGYGNAAELLRDIRGTAIPQAWQGGLPFRYHVGPGPVTARVMVRDDRATRGIKPIWNTVGIVRGFGTALLHGGVQSIFAVMVLTLTGNVPLMMARRFWAPMHWRIAGSRMIEVELALTVGIEDALGERRLRARGRRAPLRVQPQRRHARDRRADQPAAAGAHVEGAVAKVGVLQVNIRETAAVECGITKVGAREARSR